MSVSLDEYQKLVEPYNANKLFNKWAFIACVSAMLERRCYIKRGDHGYAYPTLYILFVGPPASGKTSTALLPVNMFFTGMDDAIKPILASTHLTPASLVSELKNAGNARQKYTTAPLFALIGEFSDFMEDIGGGSVKDLLLSFYDSRSPGAKWTKHTMKDGLQEIPNPALTLLGCTTPQYLISAKILNQTGTGFTRRILFVGVAEPIIGTCDFVDLDKVEKERIRGEFYRMAALDGGFTLDTGANKAYKDAWNRKNLWLRENRGTTFTSSYYAVKVDHMVQIAICLCAMRTSNKMISAEDILQAEELLNELEKTFPFVFGMQITYRDEALAYKVFERLDLCLYKSEDELLKSFLRDGQLVPDGVEFRDALRGLIKSGAILHELRDGKNYYRRGAVK